MTFGSNAFNFYEQEKNFITFLINENVSVRKWLFWNLV